jgi:hypothetical protein
MTPEKSRAEMPSAFQNIQIHETGFRPTEYDLRLAISENGFGEYIIISGVHEGRHEQILAYLHPVSIRLPN